MFSRILVKGNNWLGDIIMSYPVLSALRSRYPSAAISILTKEHLADCYDGIAGVEILSYTGFGEAVKKAKEWKADAALILPRSLNSALMIFLARIPVRVGYSYDLRKPLLTKSVPCTKEDRKIHRVGYFFKLYNLFACDSLEPQRPTFEPSRKSIEQADVLLRQYNLRDPLIGINPGAAYGRAKQYFEDRYIQVGRELASRGFDIAVTGGPSELDLCARIADGISCGGKFRAVSIAGKTPIPILAAVMKRMRLYITNDTGPMHLADAVGCRVLAIFGSTDPGATGPFRKENKVIYTAVECSPCLKRECPYGHYKCFDTIPSSRVVESALELLK